MNFTFYGWTAQTRSSPYFVTWYRIACACCGKQLVGLRVVAGVN